MKKTSLLIVSAITCCLAHATNYYVDGINGNNANAGISSGSAFKTIPTAASLTNPGDTVFIMNGTYTSTGTVLNVTRSGDATAQIVYTNYPGHFPKLQASATSFACINVFGGTSYITINGLEISGNGMNISLAADTIPAKAQLTCPVTGSPATAQNPVQKYNGHGITGDSRNSPVGVGIHHIIVRNNKIHDNAAAGVGFLKCDYITIENNVIYNNSWYTIYGTSGISFNQCYNFDNNTTTYRNIVRNNISYGNRMYVPFYNDCKVTDGNGIILDIPLIEYTGKSLVENNVCYNNGGSGIHSFKMNHTDIFNNISYLNSASPEINSSNIYALQADDIKIYNNIIVARPGKKINGINSSTNIIYDYNIYSGNTPVDVVGAHSLIQDPGFVSATTDPLTADFHLRQSSVGVNRGDNTHTTSKDFSGNSRPTGSAVDIGAYETAFTTGLPQCRNSALTQAIGRPNGIGEPGTTLYAIAETKPASGTQSRKAMIFPAGLFTGVPANTVITSLQFRRAIQTSSTNTAPSTQVVPDNTSFRVYLRNETQTNFGPGDLDWTTLLPTAANPSVLVYGGDASPIIGNAGGWKEITLQVPFVYTGGSLGVFVEYVQKGALAGATDINWIYDNGGQVLYNTTTYPEMINSFKFVTVSGSATLPNLLNVSNERHPVMMIGYCDNAGLPVTLLDFRAIKKNSNVYVSWVTATEINNAGFEVQRSKDGLYFETIGFVNSKAMNGTSTIVTGYDFTDYRLVNCRQYYRLLQKDKDGKISYSKIISISASVSQLNFAGVYPNPVTDKLNMLLNNGRANAVATISLQTLSGSVLRKTNKQLPAGYSNIEMNVASLAASTYLVIVEMPGGEKLIQKIVKN